MERQSVNRHSLHMEATPPVRLLLKAMREETGLSVRAVARKLGKPVSTYASYEDKFKKKYLPMDLVRGLERIFAGEGIPPDRVRALGGLTNDNVVAADESEDIGSDENGTAAFTELDVRGSAGGAAMGDEDAPAIVHVWRLPRELVRAASYAPPEKIKIVTLVGDSMPKTFRPYEKVMVDTSDTTPTPPGIFIIYDGLGLVVKRVEYVAHSDPPTVRIISENPDYPTYERTLGEAFIQGRVLGRWQWV